MKAVQIGAGNIGRGFLGQLYFESGYETTFIDADAGLVQLLNERSRYAVEIVDPFSRIWVCRLRAVLAGSKEAIEAISEADIASTAVGAHVLPKVVPILEEGIRKRKRPLDLILAENLPHAAQRFREWCGDERLGLVEASIGRMVPLLTPEHRQEDPLRIRVEAFCELPVDAKGFLNPIPPIKGLQPRDNFGAYVERKLYLHNLGHAAAAYFGWERSFEFIYQSMEDEPTARLVREAMDAACLGLHRRHGLDLTELFDHAADLRRRFASRPLGDTVARVGADPLRKLAPDDRIVGPIRMCLEQGLGAEALYRVAKAAIGFTAPGDPSAQKLQTMLHTLGAKKALAQITCLPPEVVDSILAC